MLYKKRIGTICPGYEKGTLDLIHTALKSEDKDIKIVNVRFSDDHMELCYNEEPSDIDRIVSDIAVLDRLQYNKLEIQ